MQQSPAELTQIGLVPDEKEVVVQVTEDLVVPLEEGVQEIDTSVLLNRLRKCESLVTELKAQLDEKTAHVQALRKELDERRMMPAAMMVKPAEELEDSEEEFEELEAFGKPEEKPEEVERPEKPEKLAEPEDLEDKVSSLDDT